MRLRMIFIWEKGKSNCSSEELFRKLADTFVQTGNRGILKNLFIDKADGICVEKVKAGVPITTAALDAGYSSSSHFAATCKSCLGSLFLIQ